MFFRNEKVKRIGFYLIQILVVTFILIFALQLWQHDFNVPFVYANDTLWSLTVIKAMVQNGWSYVIPQLSAPYEFYACTFPVISTFDGILMKIISFFTNSPGMILNIFWLTTFIITSLLASLCLQLLKINPWLSAAVGILYAFIPFVFIRNVAHLCLLYYTVPSVCLLAIYISHGWKNIPQESWIRKIGYAGCVIQGFSYIYFSFFSIILFFTAALIGYKRNKSGKSIQIALVAISLVGITSFCNMLPAFYIWSKEGKPAEYKSPIEAEIYGAKLRKMIAPHHANALPLLKAWGKKDSQMLFPNENENENENVSARLGVYGAYGFILLLAGLIFFEEKKENERWLLLQQLAYLNLAAFLIITVGGFGAVINLLTVPDIRCYNRFSPYISFLAMAGLSLFIQEGILHCKKKALQYISILGVLLLLGISLYDQLLDRNLIVGRYATDQQNVYHEKNIVAMMEKHFPSGTKVYQFPPTLFPADSLKGRMLTYDHARPFFWSNHFSWSWPSFSNICAQWQAKIAPLQGEALAKALILSNFEAIWVDRYGYNDNAVALIQSLVKAGAIELVPNLSERYAILDLRSLKNKLRENLGEKEYARQSSEILEVVIVDWLRGFHGLENIGTEHEFRWTHKESLLVFYNPSHNHKKYEVSFSIRSHATGHLHLRSSSMNRKIPCSLAPTPVVLEINLEPKSFQKIEFKNHVPRVEAPRDPRDLYLKILNFKITAKD